MTTLFIDRKGISLRADGGVLAFYDDTGRIGTVPLRLLERVCIRGDVGLSASVLGALGEQGIGLLVLNGRKRQPVLMMPALKADSRRRAAQYAVAKNVQACLRLARGWVAEKLSAQAQMLCRLAERRQGAVAASLSEAARQIDILHHRVIETVCGLDSLRGLEGAAAARYFSAWADFLPKSWHFSGRNRRPPKDGINAVLSLGYTLLHFEWVREIYLCGLDPFVGFYHVPEYGRESLACDLLESMRPLFDCWLLDQVGGGLFRPEDFSMAGEACLMGKAARLRFYPAYEDAAKSWRDRMVESCRRLLHDLGALAGGGMEFSLPQRQILE